MADRKEKGKEQQNAEMRVKEEKQENASKSCQFNELCATSRTAITTSVMTSRAESRGVCTMAIRAAAAFLGGFR